MIFQGRTFNGWDLGGLKRHEHLFGMAELASQQKHGNFVVFVGDFLLEMNVSPKEINKKKLAEESQLQLLDHFVSGQKFRLRTGRAEDGQHIAAVIARCGQKINAECSRDYAIPSFDSVNVALSELV